MSEPVITKSHHEAVKSHHAEQQQHGTHEAKLMSSEQHTLQQQLERIEHNFTYHPPKDGQQTRYETMRNKAKEFATEIAHMSPASREQSLALTHLEEAVMWANAAISRET